MASLLGTTLLNGLATAVRLGCGLLVNKLLAVWVGPAGLAVVGQFQSLMAVVGAASGAVFSAGVTKLTAEHAADPPRQTAVWRSALSLGLCGAALCALVLLVLRDTIAQWLLGDPALAPAMLALAAAALLLALNAVLLSALAGLKRFRAHVAANVLTSVLGVAAAAWLLPRHGLLGGLVALALAQAVAGLTAAAAFARVQRPRWRALIGRPDPATARSLRGYALMAATTALTVPLSMLAIREGLSQGGGASLAGHWQAMSKLSETHLLLLTTTLSLYFLPRFAEIRSGRELRAEVARGHRFVLPLVAATASAIYLLREPLTLALFTPEFLPLVQALGLQLIGDVLKIGSWVPAYTMISHARSRLYIATEIGFALLVTLACIAGAWRWGLPGAAAGYALTYALYWALLQQQLGVLVRRLDAAPA
jgi:PST family polysaccharide transporter